jgi:hypothetical protein
MPLRENSVDGDDTADALPPPPADEEADGELSDEREELGVPAAALALSPCERDATAVAEAVSEVSVDPELRPLPDAHPVCSGVRDDSALPALLPDSAALPLPHCVASAEAVAMAVLENVVTGENVTDSVGPCIEASLEFEADGDREPISDAETDGEAVSPPTCVGVTVRVASIEPESAREKPGERDTVVETDSSFDGSDERDSDTLGRPLRDDDAVRKDDVLPAALRETDDDCEGDAEMLLDPVGDKERRGDAESRSDGDRVAEVEIDRDAAGERDVEAVAAPGLFDECIVSDPSALV